MATRFTASDRETIRRALCDAISWADSFADANSNEKTGDAYKGAVEDARVYRALLKRMTGSRLLPSEKALEGATYITLHELRRRNETGGAEPGGDTQ